MHPNNNLRAPIPRRSGIDPLERAASSFEKSHHSNAGGGARSSTPNYKFNNSSLRRPLYISLESTREHHYNLDYPEDRDDIESQYLDPTLRFFARKRPRTINLPRLLPYETEPPKDQAKFLSHIILHLYIAIRTLDLQGALSITSRDLASVRAYLLDVDVALETNLFEAAAPDTPSQDINGEDDDNRFFPMDEMHDSDVSFDLDSDYDDTDDEEGSLEVEGGLQHKRHPRLAAVVGVKIWTQELLVWLSMKYEMPVLLRIALAKVYYAICLLRGQLINLKSYVKTFEVLTRDPFFMKDQGLKLPWESLLNELEIHLPGPDLTHVPAERKDRRQLIRLTERASFFFEAEALPIMFSKLGSRFNVTLAATVLSSMSILPPVFSNGKENPHDIRHYLALLFYFWQKVPRATSFPTEKHLVTLLGKTAISAMIHFANKSQVEKCQTTDFSIFDQSQLTFIFSQLLDNLAIQPQKYFSTKATFFHGYASAIVFSMKGDADDILHHINTLVNAVGSYVHPLNTGEWLRAISRMVFALIYQYHKRYNMEVEKDGLLINSPFKLTAKATTNFVGAILPLVRTGIQLKGEKVSDDYHGAQRLLAHLEPTKVLESALLDLYESLEGVLLTHRVGVALRTMENLARYFALTPIYRVHVARLLMLALPGIDSNDLEKSASTVAVFGAFANFVPLYDLSNESGDTNLAFQFTQEHLEWLQRKSLNISEPFDVPEDLEVNALKSSTAAFKEIFKAMCQRIFTLLESFPDPWKSGGAEKTFAEILPKIFFVIVESLSDDIFQTVAKEWFTFVSENTYEEVVDIAAEICGCFIKRDPLLFPKFTNHFIMKIRESIDEYGAGALRTGSETVPRDKPLLWNLTILNCCIGDANREVLKMKDELISLSYYLMDKVKGISVSYVCLYMVYQLLITVTKARITESRLISPEYEREFGIDEKCWGGFQFDDPPVGQQKFTWYFPGPQEIAFAIDVYTNHILRSLQRIQVIMKEHQSMKNNELASATMSRADELYVLFLYLGYSVSGMAYLFDPCFDEDIPKINDHSSQTIQQRLLLLNQIRLVNGTSNSKDELRIENIHENIQKLVNDFDDHNEMVLDHPDMADENININGNKSGDSHVNQHSSKTSNESINDEISSEAPSTSGTPVTSMDSSTRVSPGVDEEEMLNPGFTFRESKLYTSNYYFGDDPDDRKRNEDYIKIHNIRFLVGRSFHAICKFLLTYFLDNSLLFKAYLHALNLWFCNVGKERLMDTPHSEISYGYVASVQLINKVRKPFTRIAIGSRLDSYHQLRVSLHATSRSQTENEKNLIEDLVKLCFSPYTSISYTAQNALVDAMKRLNGSYNVLVRSAFRNLAKALDDNDTERVISGLDTFALPRIKNKIQNDYLNVQKYVELLYRCLSVDHPEINEKSLKLFSGIHNNISTPSSVCILDFDAIDQIKPPDEFIDLEVKAVKLAKENKRKIYFERLSRLQKAVLNNELQNNHWRLSTLNLCLLINMQVEVEVSINPEILEALALKASKDHPLVSRLAMKGITNIFNNIISNADFEYNFQNAFDLNFVSHDHMIVNTSPALNGQSYQLQWMEEMKNTTHANYFIDEKPSNGWFFWGKDMKVVRPGLLGTKKLRETDEKAIRLLGSHINPNWFQSIAKLWVAESDLNQTFQALDVYLTEVISDLISMGYTPNMTYQDLLSTITHIYEKDERSAHIVCCELIAGILRGSRYAKPDDIQLREAFLLDFLRSVYENDLSPDNRGVWNIFAWWIPAHVDVRRFPTIVNWIYYNYSVDPHSDAAVKIATRISYIEAFTLTTASSFPYSSRLADFAFSNFTNRYQVIRDQVGSLLSVLSFVYYSDSIASGEEFAKICNEDGGKQLFVRGAENPVYSRIPELFEFIENARLEVVDKSPQEILHSNYVYASTAVLQWLSTVLKTSVNIMYQNYVDTYIIPFLIKLTNLKDVCQLGNLDPISVIKRVSQIQYHPETLERILTLIENYLTSDSLNVIQFIIIGEFIETLYFKNLYKFTIPQRHRIISFTNELLYHKNLEVRESALSTLAGLVHFSPPEMIDELISELSSKYSKDLTKTRRKYKKGFKNITNTDVITLHGATLGLGLLINAFPFASPPPKWVPEFLTLIANKSSGLPGIIGKTAKDILGKFRKSRQDTWHIDSKVFNEDQMQDLEGVLWKSYFI